MPSGVTYVTQEHLVFVEWTLTYLAMGLAPGYTTLLVRVRANI